MRTLTLLAASLMLAGCGAAASPTVTVTAPAPVTVTAAPAPEFNPGSSDGERIRGLLATQGFAYGGPASDLDEVATSICDAMDSGIDAATLASLAMDSGFTRTEAASLVAAAIVVKCPWNSSV